MQIETVGTTILDETTKTLPRYFGVNVGRLFGVGRPALRDGTYDGGILAVVDHGKRYASFETRVILSGGRSRGTFSARLVAGGTLSGSFLCS
jgi:hypothetical protein